MSNDAQKVLDQMVADIMAAKSPTSPIPSEWEPCSAYTLTPPSSHCSRPNFCILTSGHEGPHKVLVFR